MRPARPERWLSAAQFLALSIPLLPIPEAHAANGARLRAAFSKQLQGLHSISSPSQLAKTLKDRASAPQATRYDKLALAAIEQAVADPDAFNAVDVFLRSIPGTLTSDQPALGLARVAAPFHRDGRKRRAFAEEVRKLGSSLASEPAEGELSRILGSFYDASRPAPDRKGVVAAQGPPSAKPSVRLSPVPQPEPSRALVPAEPEPVKLKEEIILQDRFKQFPTPHLIGQGYVGPHSWVADERGDHFNVTLFPQGDPFSAPSPAPASHDGALALRTSGGAHSEEDILRAYVTAVMRSEARDLPADVLSTIVRTLRNDPKTMGQAYVYWDRLQSRGRSPQLALSNKGLERFFRFKPEGAANEAAARVLDIHKDNRSGGIHLLIEWIEPSPNPEIRLRHISLLKAAELETAKPADMKERLAIQEEFLDSLSPNEILTRNLARSLRIQDFGYADWQRMPGSDGHYARDPLHTMSVLSHLAIRKNIEDRFGPIKDLLTPDEAGQSNYNVLDVMARLNPRYALRRFYSQGEGFLYAFVVTEDGQLKITPQGPAGMNMRPPSHRMAHGRRVFAAGNFTINRRGELDVMLDSNGYQHVLRAPGASFRVPGNEKLDEFIEAVFRLQTGRATASIGGVSFSGRSGARPRSQPPKRLDWDPDRGESPLKYDSWLIRAKVGAPGTDHHKVQWALYVLRVSGDHDWGAIKKAYRLMARRFHPDQNNGSRTFEPVFRLVNEAYQTLDNALNPLKKTP